MKKTLALVCLISLCNFTVLAQVAKTTRAVHTPEKSGIHVPRQEPATGLKKIYSNLGASKTDLFDDTYGYIVSGPNSNFSEFLALPFIPKYDSHVSQVQIALESSSGDNQVDLNIYSDSGGVPGTLLAGPVTVNNLPAAGTCCTLTVANFTPLEVTGGTRYWVVANTPASGTGSNFVGNWYLVVQGKVPPTGAGGDGIAWFSVPSLDELAGEVLGTIP